MNESELPPLCGPLDALRDQSRVLGESRMIRTIEDVTEDSARDVIARMKNFITTRRTYMARVAKSLGISGPTLSEVANFKYRGNWQKIIFDIDRWLEDEHKKAAVSKPTEFVLTKVAESILAAANAAITLQTIGLVFGPSGIGKSIALRAVAAEKPGAILVSAQTASSSTIGVLELIAAQLGIVKSGRMGSRQLAKQITFDLKCSGRLLIVDEIHKLIDKESLTVLRDLQDNTGDPDSDIPVIPMLWSGTTDLIADLEKQQAKGREPLAQIRSRIGVVVDLMDRAAGGSGNGGEPLFTTDEVRKVFARQKMKLTSDAARYLMALANLPQSGGLRACKNLVVMAEKLYQGKQTELTAEMLRSVQKLLVNDRVYKLLDMRMAEFSPARVARVG